MKKKEITKFIGGVDISYAFKKTNDFAGLEDKLEFLEELLVFSNKSDQKNIESRNNLIEERKINHLIEEL
jgi:hypothetical protein